MVFGEHSVHQPQAIPPAVFSFTFTAFCVHSVSFVSFVVMTTTKGTKKNVLLLFFKYEVPLIPFLKP